MATASKQTQITLELSPEEAQTLHDVLGSINGNPFSSRRSITDDIYEALEPLVDDPDHGGMDDITQELEFGDVT